MEEFEEVRLPVQAYNGSTVTVEVQPGGNEQGIFLLEHAEEINVERIGSDGNRDGFVAGRFMFDQLGDAVPGQCRQYQFTGRTGRRSCRVLCSVVTLRFEETEKNYQQ